LLGRIRNRLATSALVFAKSDFERGQALMKSGFITKQAFEERLRNYESAERPSRT